MKAINKTIRNLFVVMLLTIPFSSFASYKFTFKNQTKGWVSLFVYERPGFRCDGHKLYLEAEGTTGDTKSIEATCCVVKIDIMGKRSWIGFRCKDSVGIVTHNDEGYKLSWE